MLDNRQSAIQQPFDNAYDISIAYLLCNAT